MTALEKHTKDIKKIINDAITQKLDFIKASDLKPVWEGNKWASYDNKKRQEALNNVLLSLKLEVCKANEAYNGEELKKHKLHGNKEIIIL